MGNDKQPAGGYDSTKLEPANRPCYSVKITFHRATNVPIADMGARSSDPYVLAQLNTSLKPRHTHDPYLRFRTETKHKTVKPEWNATWVVAGVPEDGFELKARLFDEDPDDHDDRLGKVHYHSGRLSEKWQGPKEESFKVHKTGANFRAYTLRWCASAMKPGRDVHAHLVISIEVLGRTKEDLGKAYTINNFWWIHYSPLIGRLAGTKSNDETGVESFNFQANELQLQGPVPNELYHRYVEFKSFVGGMFEGTGPRGKVLHVALHKQHARIYQYNKRSKHGILPDGPGREMTLKFLEMAHFDQGGRIFTYVISLDGLLRFTETGKQFGIDLLSKHTMHSDVSRYIAWSGEFLIRRVAHPKESATDPDQHTHPAEQLSGGPPSEAPPKDPEHYELVIDNDSGTYRPNGDLLPVLHDFLQRNFPGLHILVKSCTDKELEKIKESQKEAQKEEGDQRVYGQGSDAGSISSSEADDLQEHAQNVGHEHQTKMEKIVAATENPKAAVNAILPGRSEKEEREAAETRDDEKAAAGNTNDGKA